MLNVPRLTIAKTRDVELIAAKVLVLGRFQLKRADYSVVISISHAEDLNGY
jgi:hypothetical protein